MMKKTIVVLLCSGILWSSCSSYQGAGAYAGAYFGNILGSAIGSLSDDGRNRAIGSIVGTVGGAAVGAVLGAVAEKKAMQAEAEQAENRSIADDRLYPYEEMAPTGGHATQDLPDTAPCPSVAEPSCRANDCMEAVEIINARFIDENEDGTLQRGEQGKVIFEIWNRGNSLLTDVLPLVEQPKANRHIRISPSVPIARIAPQHGVRYTALVQAGSRLKNGFARITVRVLHRGKTLSMVQEFKIPTRKK